MYKILIRNREITESTVEKFSFYKEASKDYETGSIQNALSKMNDLLDSYLRKDILLANMVETETEVVSPELKLITIKPSIINVINDGTKFQIDIILSDESNYVVVDTDETVFAPIRTQLEALGLTNIKLTAKSGITAVNTSGTPVEAVIDVAKGLFVFYSKETLTSNYISAGFAVTIKPTSEGSSTDGDGEEREEIDPDPTLYNVIFANNYSTVMRVTFQTENGNKLLTIQSNDQASIRLEAGNYNYTVTANGYKTQNGNITVGGSTTVTPNLVAGSDEIDPEENNSGSNDDSDDNNGTSEPTDPFQG